MALAQVLVAGYNLFEMGSDNVTASDWQGTTDPTAFNTSVQQHKALKHTQSWAVLWPFQLEFAAPDPRTHTPTPMRWRKQTRPAQLTIRHCQMALTGRAPTRPPWT